ncbi:MAG: putative nucleotidyltransferase substrate binding domain-containing protein [Gammaproteobacteria bacterium]|nr:putative nucleotidyltransferase substrate binding domain-containing protein [Gammaproteobacteria bacterium]
MHSSNTFNADVLPFNLLDEEEYRLLQDNLDIGYYQAGEIIISTGDVPEGLYIILKGCVSELDVQNIEAHHGHTFVHYTNDDYFGAWSALRGSAIHDFVADEETICYILPTKILLDLIYRNPNFGDFFNKNLTLQNELLEQKNDSLNMTEFMLARIDSSCMREAPLLPSGTDLEGATRFMSDNHVDCVLIRRGKRYGMVTRTDLLNAIVLDKLPVTDDVQGIANYRLITVEAGDYLFNALILMTLHQIDRVVVMQGSELHGIIDLADTLSYFSSHSHVVGLRIERATSIEELKAAAGDMGDLIRSLYSQGVKVRFAMDLLAALNKRLMSKLFNLIVPESVLPHVCLVVMGSEGRGEQIVKIDQDNGLIMRDGLDWPECQTILQQYSKELVGLGFPECPGRVMVSNSFWVLPISDWTSRMRGWVAKADSESLLNLSISVDAYPVAGNKALFKTSRNWLLRELKQQQRFLSSFAKVALVFETPLNFLGGIRDRAAGVDVKKGGIFPIVHGVRVLAMQHQVAETNTYKRIEALIKMGVLPQRLGSELMESFSILQWFRLAHHMHQQEQQCSVEDLNNDVSLGHLDRLDKDLLRQSFQVVKDFKKHLSLRYRLGVGL